MKDKTTYTALIERSGDWWAIKVPEVPGAFSQARRLDQVEKMAAQTIAAMLDISADEIIVAIVVEKG